MRFFIYGIILTLLCTATHVLVDHGVEGQKSFAFLPHPCLSHVHSAHQHPGIAHADDHQGEPSREHDPAHHAADTHQHGVWSTSVSATSGLDCTPSLFKVSMMIGLAIADTSSALYGLTPEPLPRGLPLYLQCSTLRI
jgi:hypothetical protein